MDSFTFATFIVSSPSRADASAISFSFVFIKFDIPWISSYALLSSPLNLSVADYNSNVDCSFADLRTDEWFCLIYSIFNSNSLICPSISLFWLFSFFSYSLNVQRSSAYNVIFCWLLPSSWVIISASFCNDLLLCSNRFCWFIDSL